MRRGSSRLRILLPTKVSVLVIVVAMVSLRLRLCRGGFHRVDDVLVAGATAQIAVQAVTDLFLARLGIALDNLLDRHDHAGRAETALQPVLVPKGFLYGVQLAVSRQTFDGENIAAVRLHRKHGATLDRFAVDMHCASAA